MDLRAFQKQFNGGYYHYRGSLTTPPCNEKVHWYVLKQPAPVTKQMVQSFQKNICVNNRVVQNLNDRKLVLNQLGLKDEFPKAPLRPLFGANDQAVLTTAALTNIDPED